MKKTFWVVPFLLIWMASAAQAVTMDTASTQTVTGSNIYTSTRAIVLQPSGNLDTQIGATANSTSGAFIFDVSKTTGPGVVIFNNGAQSVNSANSFLVLIGTNTNYGGYFIRIFRNDGNSNGEIRVDAPAPNYEEVETDQVSPAGKWEHGVNADKWYVASRNAADNSYERVFEVTARRGTPAIVMLNQANLTFEDASGSQMSLKAPSSFGATWSHELWNTHDNVDKMLAQTTNSPPRTLAWVDTYCTPKTLTQLKADAPSRAGNCYYCSSGCTVDPVCYSTGTVAGAVASGSNRTAACH